MNAFHSAYVLAGLYIIVYNNHVVDIYRMYKKRLALKFKLVNT
jgi:hypothetical protein